MADKPNNFNISLTDELAVAVRHYLDTVTGAAQSRFFQDVLQDWFERHPEYWPPCHNDKSITKTEEVKQDTPKTL